MQVGLVDDTVRRSSGTFGQGRNWGWDGIGNTWGREEGLWTIDLFLSLVSPLVAFLYHVSTIATT